jgi:triacylglycerol esterase/lipase EstA (alpha/beta hydrolase family)
MLQKFSLTAAIGCLVLVASLACTASSSAATYAPLNHPGPPLSVSRALLSEALVCTGNLAGSKDRPILLVPGTTVTPREDFAWNWEVALADQNWPFCTIQLPDDSMGDIQVAGEYVVYAIRTMYAEAHRKIDIVGHSQGGMVPRWALRFWPDTRHMVQHDIGLSASNHGTLDAIALCAAGCAPAIWQQTTNATFLKALNSRAETFPGIDYTEIYTYTDEVVVPNSGPHPSSAVAGGGGTITNVAIQQVCPNDVAEHLGIGTYDNTAYQIAMEALTHSGSGDPALVPKSVCLDPLMPGVNPLTFATDFGDAGAAVATALATTPFIAHEPPLACYVTASCRRS